VLVFCEFMLGLFRILIVLMIGFIVFGVIPYAAMLINEELGMQRREQTEAHTPHRRHRRLAGDDDTYMRDLVIRFRDGRQDVIRHKRVAHG
jgi:hypothetical protein